MNCLSRFLLVVAALASLGLGTVAEAATTPVLAVSVVSGDVVQAAITGDASSSVRLSFLPPGASQLITTTLGTTDSSGRLSATISSGGYGIPVGSPAYVTVNGLQSTTIIWPSYTSSLSLSPNSIQIGVGQGSTITASHAATLVANSNPSSFGTSVSGSQVTVSGLANGFGTASFCAASVGCAALTITVGGQTGQSAVSLSQNSVSLSSGQSKDIIVFGPSGGFVITSNSNPGVVEASISGQSSSLILYAKNNAGNATVTICSATNTTNCATLVVTTSGATNSVLSFSQNTVGLVPGQAQTVTVAGGGGSYYLSSNSNSGVVQATVNNNSVTLIGGSNTGTAIILICSATTSNACGNFTVITSAASSATTTPFLTFSQNVLSVPFGQTVTVTASGGSGSGYVVASNSNSSLITASANTASSTIYFSVNAASGSGIVTVCATNPATTCGSVYVTAVAAPVQLTFSQNNVSLRPGQSTNIIIYGNQGGSGYTISSNSNPNAVAASLGSGQSLLVLTAKATTGSAAITICSVGDSSNCASLHAYSVPAVNQSPAVSSPAPAAAATSLPAPATTPVSSAVKYKFTSLLTLGSTGTEVRELQKILIQQNLLKSTVTGRFGALTQAAVKAFQKKHGITVAGYVGPATRAKLNSF